MMQTRKAFTMIELVFVIVILGILAAVAIPKFAATRTDAEIAKAKSTVAAVRSGIINERQARLFRGDNTYINQLDSNATVNAAGVTIFDNNGSTANSIMMYGVTTSGGNGWLKTATNTYRISIAPYSAVFTYNPTTGTFTCAGGTGNLCSKLTN